jgi:hypothetical protein
MRKIITVIFVFFLFLGFSQSNKQKNALFTIRGNVGTPKPLSSQMFRTSFAGVYEANLSFNLRVFENAYVGLGYQNTFFKNNDFLKYTYFNTSIPYNTKLSCNGIFFKLGYDKFFSDKGYVSYALNSGFVIANYMHVNPDTNAANKPYGVQAFNAPYLQPEISVNFIVDKTLSFSLMMSYATMFYSYDPKAPRFNHFQEIQKSSNKYVMSWINIGFGFNILLNKK